MTIQELINLLVEIPVERRGEVIKMFGSLDIDELLEPTEQFDYWLLA